MCIRDSFGIVRKAKKKAPTITSTEATVFAEQAGRAGMTVAQAVRECVLRGWSRFEASWLPPQAASMAPPAVYVPEVAQPVTPAIKAEGMAALERVRAKFVPNADPLSWARNAIERDTKGERVGHALLRNARMALRI